VTTIARKMARSHNPTHLWWRVGADKQRCRCGHLPSCNVVQMHDSTHHTTLS
jgi:hypothetical protein